MSDLSKSSSKAAIWSFSTMLVSQLRNFVVSVILARLLTPADFGLISMAMVLNVILDAFADFGIGNAIIRKEQTSQYELSTIFYLSIVLGVICAGIVFISAPLVAIYFEEVKLVNVVRVISISFILSSTTGVHSALLQKSLQFHRIFRARLISGIISAVVGIYLAFRGYGVWALVGSTVINWIIYGLCIWVETNWWPSLTFRYKYIPDLFSFGWKFTFTTILNRIFRQIDTMVIGKISDAYLLGLFNRAQSLNKLIVDTAFSSIRPVILPTFSKLQNSDVKILDTTYKLLHMVLFVSCFLSGVLYASADQLVVIIYGDAWEQSAVIFKIIGLFSVSAILPIIYDSLLIIKNRMSDYVWISVIRKIIYIIVLPVAFCYDVILYIWVTSIASLVNMIPYLYSAKNLLGWKIRSQAYMYVRYIVPLFILAYIMRYISIGEFSIVINAFINVGIAAVIYIMLTLFLGNKGCFYIFNFIKNKHL